MKLKYPATETGDVIEELHGIQVPDPYRWLEDGTDRGVLVWMDRQEALARTFLDALPQRQWLIEHNRDKFFYDDERPPKEVLLGDREFWWTKRKEDEHWVYHTRVHPGSGRNAAQTRILSQ